MNKKQQISQSGGSLSIGGIVQGDHNQVSIDARNVSVTNAGEEARQQTVRLGADLQKAKVEVDAVVTQLEELEAQAKSDSPTPSKGKAILETIQQNFSWAYPVIKDFVAIAWPALLGLIGH